MRLFLAVNLDDELRARIASATSAARAAAPHVAWVRSELLHLTVKFLGERPEGDVPRIVESASRVTAASRPLDASLHGVGAFPNFRAPRVVWIGMENARPLEEVARGLDGALESLGIAGEARPFRAHLTLGRVKAPLGGGEGEVLERALRGVRERWPLAVRSIDLMRSELSSAGARYTRLSALRLGGG